MLKRWSLLWLIWLLAATMSRAYAADGPSVIEAGVHECEKVYRDSFKQEPIYVLRNGDQWIVRFGSASDYQKGAYVAVIDARTGEGKGCSLHPRYWREPGGREVERYFRDLNRHRKTKNPFTNP
jgi:hypothetical protein